MGKKEVSKYVGVLCPVNLCGYIRVIERKEKKPVSLGSSTINISIVQLFFKCTNTHKFTTTTVVDLQLTLLLVTQSNSTLEGKCGKGVGGGCKMGRRLKCNTNVMFKHCRCDSKMSCLEISLMNLCVCVYVVWMHTILACAFFFLLERNESELKIRKSETDVKLT